MLTIKELEDMPASSVVKLHGIIAVKVSHPGERDWVMYSVNDPRPSPLEINHHPEDIEVIYVPELVAP